VIGNIEKYPLEGVTNDEVIEALDRVYSKYPELRKTDTTKYGRNNGKDFHFILNMENKQYVFNCHLINYSGGNYGPIDLSLTTATEWGQVMDLAPNMGFMEKRRYRRLFEDNILPRIKEELNAIQHQL
jgi:hypothetical protein